MADMNADELIRLSERLFSKKLSLDSLRQRLADEFFPERANFLVERVDGNEYQRNSYESVPAYNRRTLADAIGALTRPKQQTWMKVRPEDEALHTDRALAWCDWATGQIHKLLYSRKGNFHRSMRMGDNDIVSFGDGVVSISEAADRSGRPMFDWHHLRDCAWTRNREHECDVFHRKWKIEIREFAKKWGADKLPDGKKKVLETDPFQEIEVRHICMPSGRYDGYKTLASKGKPWVSIYICPESRSILREGGYFEFPYIVRPWEMNDYSPYGYSPAAMLGLCDARLLQSQAAVILDAGERVVNPPLVATQEAVLGGVNNYAGSITWLDPEYDERLGQALRPLETVGNLNIGLEMKVDTREVLAAVWYINKLNLPSDKDMTAYEVGERVSEYIRSIGPVIEPFETHNQMVLDNVFQMALRLGKLGAYQDIPPEIRGADIGFEIEGPVRAAFNRQKTVKVGETLQGAATAAQLFGPSVLDNFDADELARDAAKGVGGEQKWLKPIEVVAQKRQADAEAAAKQQQMQEAAQAIDMAKHAASAIPAAAAANMAIPAVREGMPSNDNQDDGSLPEGLQGLLELGAA